MLQRKSFKEYYGYDPKELVYIPTGAEKGDCPYCYHGVLRRDPTVEQIYDTKEGYICANCGIVYDELFRRFFRKIAIDIGLK